MSNPIIDKDGTKWYRNEQGQLHRTDGPAVEWADGSKEWWVNGKCLTEAEFKDLRIIAFPGYYREYYINDRKIV